MPTIVRGQNVSAAWEAYVPADPVDNIFARHWLLEQLRKNGSFEKENGSVIRANLEYALNPNFAFITELGTVTVDRPETFDNAEYVWKLCAAAAPFTDLEEGITSGGARKYDLKARRLENMKKTMDERSNTSLFSDGSGTGGLEFGGLQLLVSSTPTTGTVGLINRATYSFWRNQQSTGTKTTNPGDNLLSALEENYNNCSNGIAKENPTFAVTTQTVFQIYNSLVPTLERFVRESSNDKLVRGFKGDNVMFKDIPVGYDGACPSGNWYNLNNRNLKFVYMFWQRSEASVRAVDAFYDVFKAITIGNLITDNSRRLGVVSAIT